jgi:hypothetical protein
LRSHAMVVDGATRPDHAGLWVPSDFQNSPKRLRYVARDRDRLRLVETYWPDETTWEKAVRVEAERPKNPRKAASDIPQPIYWRGSKIPDVGNGRKTERVFRETQEWKNADDWLWTKMERVDMQGNVLLRCEATKVKHE